MLLIYAPRKLTLSPMQFNRYDTVVMVTLPKDLRGYFTSEFKTNKIEQISDSTQMTWVGILNIVLTEEIVIKYDRPFVFFVLESKGNINIKYEATETRKKVTSKISKKKTKEQFFK